MIVLEKASIVKVKMKLEHYSQLMFFALSGEVHVRLARPVKAVFLAGTNFSVLL